jgi:hypothetical protein
MRGTFRFHEEFSLAVDLINRAGHRWEYGMRVRTLSLALCFLLCSELPAVSRAGSVNPGEAVF